MFGTRDLHAISNTNAMTDLARALTAVRQDVFVYLALPRRQPGSWTYRDDLYAGERIAPVFYDSVLDDPASELPMIYEQMFLDVKVWNLLNDKSKHEFYVDAIINERNEFGVLLKNATSYTTQIYRDIPVICNMTDVPWTLRQREPLQKAYTLNVAADWGWWQFPNDLRLARPLLRRYLSSSEIARITDPALVCTYPIDLSRLDRAIAELGPRPQRTPRLFYGGRLMGKKRLAESLDLAAPLWTLGKIAGYTITTQTDDPEQAKPLQARPFVTFFGPPSPRELFFRRAHEGDIFHCLSIEEASGFGYFEALLLGQVGIFHKQPWMDGVLPADYPFAAANLNEVRAMTLWAADNLEEAQRRCEPARAQIRAFFDAQNVARKFLGHVDRIVAYHHARNAHDGGKSKMLLGALREGLDGLQWPDRLELPQLYDAVQRHTAHGLNLKQMRFRIGKHAVLDALAALGYDDDCQQETPVLVRRTAPGAPGEGAA